MKIILIEPEISGNTGFIARVMKNFDFKDLILINPKFELDETKRFAMNAKEIIDNSKIINSIQNLKKSTKTDLLIGFSAKTTDDYNTLRAPISLSQLINLLNEKKVLKNPFNQNIGLVFGRESNGMTNKEIEICDILVTIPTSQNYRAMNLSHSIAIVLYELYQNYLKLQIPNKEKILSKKKNREENLNEIEIEFMNNKDLEILKNYIYKIIDKNFEDEFHNNIQKNVWSKIFGKSLLTKREAIDAMGLLRKIDNYSKEK